ncbi:MAG: DoxX family membrane protein, partial [Deltaproteobacteria bacterium]|nr:DoxX family membrane protein [Deltaproteobacteria bacterium]
MLSAKSADSCGKNSLMLHALKKAALAAFPISQAHLSGADYVYASLYHLLRLALGCLFIYAGLIKLLDPRAFAHTIAQFDLMPDQLLPVLAIGLPALELLAGVGLIFERRGSLTAIAILLGLFLLALSYAVWMEMDIDCGCFTVDQINAQTGVKTALVRDLCLAAALGFLFWRRRRAG